MQLELLTYDATSKDVSAVVVEKPRSWNLVNCCKTARKTSRSRSLAMGEWLWRLLRSTLYIQGQSPGTK